MNFVYLRFNFPNLISCEKISKVFFFCLIRYESEFFQSVVNGVDIISWAAVDRSRPDDHCDELIGFVTAKFVLAKDSEVSFHSLESSFRNSNDNIF